MNNLSIAQDGYYVGLCNELATLLQLSFSEIKRKYIKYPIHVMDQYKQGNVDKSAIEIRFDEESLTVTCICDEEGKCSCVYLFPDGENSIEEIITYIKNTYEFSYIKNRWTASGYYIAIRETSYPPNDVYLLIYT